MVSVSTIGWGSYLPFQSVIVANSSIIAIGYSLSKKLSIPLYEICSIEHVHSQHELRQWQQYLQFSKYYISDVISQWIPEERTITNLHSFLKRTFYIQEGKGGKTHVQYIFYDEKKCKPKKKWRLEPNSGKWASRHRDKYSLIQIRFGDFPLPGFSELSQYDSILNNLHGRKRKWCDVDIKTMLVTC